jgi:hypothetical protein
MGYAAVGIGENEVALKLGDALAEHALQFRTPRVVSANLMDAEKHFPEQTAPWQLVGPAGSPVKVGITSVTGPLVATQIKQFNARANEPVRFSATPGALDEVWKEMAAKKVNLPVLLYQGPMSRTAGKGPPTEAIACAEAFPQFPLVLCLGDDADALIRPVGVRTKAGTQNLVICVGRKGKFVGVVGVYRTGNPKEPFTFRYQRAEMTEAFLTPREKEAGHPIIELMEAYTRELKSGGYLAKVGQRTHELQALPPVPNLRNPGKPGEPVYVGSQACKSCHKKEYRIWEKTPHHHAYDTLVKATRPSNRQYDPECIVCHTVGFGYRSGFVGEKETPKLKDVGCESCHGPASLHVANPNDTEWQKRVNLWKHLPANKREDAMDQFCQKCHDEDNDVTWIGGGFKRKWPKIAH